MHSGFEHWFTLRFGKRGHSTSASDSELIDLIASGLAAQAEMSRRKEWDAKYAAALYAWQIDEHDKEQYRENANRPLVRD